VSHASGRRAKLNEADDRAIWQFAKNNGFTIVSLEPPGRQRSQDGNRQVVLRLGHAVGGRERRSTAAVQTLARLPGDSPITRSVWTAVALAPLWCLIGPKFKKIRRPDRKLCQNSLEMSPV